jgi:glycosyltransferase involved in cell wall biosynthesis
MSPATSAERLRLLFLMPFPPRLDATHGGGRVAAQLLSALAAHHRVAILAMRADDEPPVDDLLRARCEWVEEVSRPWTSSRWHAQCIRNGRLVAGLARLNPMWVSDCRSDRYALRAAATARAWCPDVVHIEHHVMGQYLPALKACPAPRVLTEHEPGVRAAPYLKRRLPVLSSALHLLDALAWRRYEPGLLRQVQATIVFTAADRQILERLAPDARVVVIPFGTQVPSHRLDPLGRPPQRLLFVGNYRHPPNIDAALRLAGSIFPAVRARVPGVQLELVGDHPPPELLRLRGEDISVTGRVTDVRPYLDHAAVVVAPLGTGGGMRVKVLEALAGGKAMVVSSLAAEGLEVHDGEQLYIASTEAEFVTRTIELLCDESLRAALGNRARAWAVEHLGWSSSLAGYQRLYASLLDQAVLRPLEARAS